MTETVEWHGKQFTFSLSWRQDGSVGEIFIDGNKVGSDVEAAVDQAAIQASYALQSGLTLRALAERTLDTPVGVVLRRALELEREFGASERLVEGSA